MVVVQAVRLNLDGNAQEELLDTQLFAEELLQKDVETVFIILQLKDVMTITTSTVMDVANIVLLKIITFAKLLVNEVSVL